jgi:hypothetical protein
LPKLSSLSRTMEIWLKGEVRQAISALGETKRKNTLHPGGVDSPFVRLLVGDIFARKATGLLTNKQAGRFKKYCLENPSCQPAEPSSVPWLALRAPVQARSEQP